MSDERMRELERRFKQSGALADEVAWLHERVRAGDLTRARLELAATLGHAAAREVVPEAGATPRSLGDLVAGLEHWDKEPLVLAAVVAVRLALPTWEKRYPADLRPRQALEAAERWLECPCERHVTEAREAMAQASVAGEGIPPPTVYGSRVEEMLAADAAAFAAACAGSAPGQPHPAGGVPWPAAEARSAVFNAVTVVGGDRVREAVTQALLAWALA